MVEHFAISRTVAHRDGRAGESLIVPIHRDVQLVEQVGVHTNINKRRSSADVLIQQAVRTTPEVSAYSCNE